MSLSTIIQDYTEGKIDFVGQQRVEQISRFVLITTTVISFILGFVFQSLTVTFGTFGTSTIALALFVLPPWPMFNHHPVKWLPVADEKRKES